MLLIRPVAAHLSGKLPSRIYGRLVPISQRSFLSCQRGQGALQTDSRSWPHHGHVASSSSWPCTCGRHGRPSGWACRYGLHQPQFLQGTAAVVTHRQSTPGQRKANTNSDIRAELQPLSDPIHMRLSLLSIALPVLLLQFPAQHQVFQVKYELECGKWICRDF